MSDDIDPHIQESIKAVKRLKESLDEAKNRLIWQGESLVGIQNRLEELKRKMEERERNLKQ